MIKRLQGLTASRKAADLAQLITDELGEDRRLAQFKPVQARTGAAQKASWATMFVEAATSGLDLDQSADFLFADTDKGD